MSYIVTLNQTPIYEVSVQALADGTIDGSMGVSRTITINGQGIKGDKGDRGDDGPAYTLPTANTTTLGGVKVDGATITIDEYGVISAAVSGSNGAIDLSGFQTEAGLSSNVAQLTANNTSFVGSISAANVVSNSQLQSNLANYALLTGASFAGNVSVTKLVANGSTGSAGQVLTTGGDGNVYWSTVTSASNTSPDLSDVIVLANAAYSNAIAIASIDAQSKAANAYSNAVSTAAADASTKAATSYSNAVSVAAIDASNKAAVAYSNAVSYADTKAASAYSNATSYVDAKIANSQLYTDARSANAYSNAVSYTDTKAAAAYTNAVSYADTKAADAYANATSYSDTKAAAAYTNATSYADTKATAAYANATSYTNTQISNVLSVSAANTYVNNTFATKVNSSLSGNVAVTGNVSISGTLNTNNVVIQGNLTVSGTTTTINTTELSISDNIITLNSDASGSPTENAGIEVNRGSSANVAIRWNETTDKWQMSIDNSGFVNIASTDDVSQAYSNAVSMIGQSSGGGTGDAGVAYANAVSYANTRANEAYSNAVVVANTLASAAYTNATSYADTKAAAAYTNATSYADTKASTAYANAISYANTVATSKAGEAYSNAASLVSTAFSNATTYTDTKAGAAYTNAVSYTDTAYSNAISYANTIATSKAGEAYSNSIGFANTIAATAYANAVIVAAADASGKATTAYSNAVSTAAADATSKADAAYSNAVSKVGEAYTNAISYANTVSSAAYTNAIAYAAANTYVNQTFAALTGAAFTGNVSTNGTLTTVDAVIQGNLTVSGTTTYINTTTLNIGDNIITLNADANGSPTENAGIEVNRGTSANASIRWNETTDRWQLSANSATFLNIATTDDVATATASSNTAYANAISYANTVAALAYSNAQMYVIQALAGYMQLGGGTFTGNVTFSESTIVANGSVGTSGHVLTTNGSGGMYWAAPAGGSSSNTTTVGYGDNSNALDVMGWSRIGNSPGNFSWDLAHTILLALTGSDGSALKTAILALVAGDKFDLTYYHPTGTGSYIQHTISNLTVVNSGESGGSVSITVEENLYSLLQAYFDSGAATPTVDVTYTAQIQSNKALSITIAAPAESTGLVNVTETGANVFIGNTTSQVVINGSQLTANASNIYVSGATTFDNVVTFSQTISANGGVGDAGQVLTSAGSGNVYWANAASGGSGVSSYTDLTNKPDIISPFLLMGA